MMIRTVLAVTALALGVSAATAQDPIAARKALMKSNGQQFYGVLNKMQRGQDPYDQTKVDAAFAALVDNAQKLPPLFPASSKPARPSGDYDASNKVWENKSDFDAQLAKLAKDIGDNRAKAKNLDELKDVYRAINQNCGGCHEHYRHKNG
jgi:cytochrome c556